MMKREEMRRGSTLGWVIMVIMAMGILIMFALTVSVAHISRNQRYHNRRQAQITAISVAQAIAEDFGTPADEGSIKSVMEQLIAEHEEGKIELGGLDSDMGQAAIEYEVAGEVLVLTVRVALKQAEESVVLTMRSGRLGGNVNEWEILGYRAEKERGEKEQ